MYAHHEITHQGIHIHILSCTDDTGTSEVWIAPGFGMNLCRFLVDGIAIIDFEPEALKTDFSGTPLLYPTPNRVVNGVFRYKDRDYPQVKRGKPILAHGLLYDEPFQGVAVETSDEGVSLAAHIDFEPGDALHATFPFRHTIEVRYTLRPREITFEYAILNRDEQDLPYGIAIHPYFMKLDGDDGTFLSAPFTHRYENLQEDLIPTGRLLPVDGTDSDIRTELPLGGLDLDTVYAGNTANLPARIHHAHTGWEVVLECSPEFSRMVVYTPPGQPFFCMENQTCATDAHNLYERGLQTESGLRILPPGAIDEGFVRFRVHPSEVRP